MLLADSNPRPVAVLAPLPLANPAHPSSAGTQNVIAVAKMANGTFQQAANTVKVTIGGCGGNRI